MLIVSVTSQQKYIGPPAAKHILVYRPAIGCVNGPLAGRNTANDGSDVVLSPDPRTMCSLTNILFLIVFFYVSYSSTVYFRDWVGPY